MNQLKLALSWANSVFQIVTYAIVLVIFFLFCLKSCATLPSSAEKQQQLTREQLIGLRYALR